MSRWELLILGLVAFGAVVVEGFDLTVLHTNDVHSRFEEANVYGGRCPEKDAGKCFGGMARMWTKIKEIRETEKNVILLNAGDYYQGTMWYSIHKWRIVTVFMNLLTHDAMALGNHEFDDDIPGLVPFLRNATFPIISCNINASLVPEVEKYLRKHVVLNLEGEKIGVVGYITPETKVLSSPGDLEFGDEIECLKQEVAILKEQGINKIIALGHSGFTKDKEIAAKVPGIDLVVGGHTDTFLYNGTEPSIEKPVDVYPVVVQQEGGGKCLVVQDYTFGKYLGYLQISFDEQGELATWNGNPILLDSSIQQDPRILEILKPFTQEVIDKGKDIVGKTRVLLRGDRLVCRLRECNLGNLMTDAWVHHFLKQPHPEEYWTRVATAFLNSGGIRASIDEKLNQGNITREDVISVSPFSNTIDIVELYGSDVMKVLEHSVFNYDSSAEDMPGAFLQVSGATVKYDITQPPGHRVVQVHMKCSKCRIPKLLPLNESEIYPIAMPSFMINGGDGYKMIKSSAVNIWLTNSLDADIYLKYLEETTPVITGLEGRISFQDAPTTISISGGRSGTAGLSSTSFSCFTFFSQVLSSLF